MTIEGTEFINARPEVVINYLENRQIRKINISPSDLIIKSSGRYLTLGVGRTGEEYPLRSTFLRKLLRWYSFPSVQLSRLTGDTIASICNDFLLNIASEFVTITLEHDEALTITGPNYIELTDLEIIKKISPLGLRTISRNDFMMRAATKEKYKFQPKPGDNCGAGICVINSETGFRALNISHFMLRYICTNGAIISINKESKSKVHYGNQKNGLSEFLNEQVKAAEENRGKLKERFEFMTKIKALDNKDILEKVKSILGKRESIKIAKDATLYDLFNLVTEKAKTYDLSRRMYLESAAGEMVG